MSAQLGQIEGPGNDLADTQLSADRNFVQWDGPEDAANPRNWSQTKKNCQLFLVSAFSLFGNLAATMFAPGANELADEFQITSSMVVAMTITIYVLGFAVGPLLLGPLSENYGRLGVYHICSAAFIIAMLACAFSTNTPMFIAFRLASGCAASGPPTIGGGIVADIMVQEERGKAMALLTFGPLLGPVIGPIVGGFVAQDIGWRWTFRILLILASVIGGASLLLLDESNPIVLLRRKTERLRKQTGNEALIIKGHMMETSPVFRAIIRPAKLLIFSPVVLLLSTYMGIVFGLIFLLFSTFPVIFGDVYGFGPAIAGLAYLGLGIGMVLGILIFGIMSDKLLGRGQNTGGLGDVAEPEMRLILMKYLAPVAPLGCFFYGWTAYYQLHWILPIFGTFVIGLGNIFVSVPVQVYLVDAFDTEAAASAIGASLLVRSTFGAFTALVAPPLYGRLGLGWGNSVLGFICLAFTPVPWIFYRHGKYLRERFAVELY